MHRDVYTTRDTALQLAASIQFATGVRTVDLGCGDGVFLEAAGHVLVREHRSRVPDADALAAALTGVDVNPASVAKARQRLTSRFGKPKAPWDVRVGDALELEENEAYDVALGNPPWVRLKDINCEIRCAARGNFHSAKGAFDICYLFVEKALRLLVPRGELVLVVPRGIQAQPAARHLRELLDATGEWSLERLDRHGFRPAADIDPAVLRLVKRAAVAAPRPQPTGRRPVLGDICHVTTGVATGSDSVFLVNDETIHKWNLEKDVLRPALRGRDVAARDASRRSPTVQVVWPYRDHGDRWQLIDLSDTPNIRSYLEHAEVGLRARPRLATYIQRNPSEWYRFIDAKRPRHYKAPLRIALADVFHSQAFVPVADDRTVILNTCFAVVPKPGCERQVTATLEDPAFWHALRRSARALRNGYRRLSGTELRQTPLTD